MLSPEERQKLMEDIKAEVMKDITGRDFKAANSKTGPLSEVREKYKDLLHKKYGHYVYWQVWENIRRLSCYIAGVRYVRDLTPSKETVAAEVAEKLLKLALIDIKEDE